MCPSFIVGTGIRFQASLATPFLDAAAVRHAGHANTLGNGCHVAQHSRLPQPELLSWEEGGVVAHTFVAICNGGTQYSWFDLGL